MVRALASTLCFVLVGCDCGTGTRPQYGEARILPGPELTTGPDGARLDFGDVEFGQQRTLSVEILNSGSGALTIASVDGEAAPFMLTEPPLPLDVPPGESRALVMTFAPPVDDEEYLSVPYSNQTRLNLGGTERIASLVLDLRGRGVIGDDCVLLAPNPLEFGPVPMGCGASRSATLTNACSEPLLLTGVTAEGQGFSVTSDPTDGGLTIGSGDVVTLSARFDAADGGSEVGALRAALLLRGRASARRLTLTAVSSDRARVTESFPVLHALDVLILSPYNNAADQEALGRNVVGLMDEMEDAGVDFHAGFVAPFWDYVVPSGCPDCPPNPEVLGQLVSADAGTPLYYTATTQDRSSLAVASSVNAMNPRVPNAARPIPLEAVRRAINPPVSNGINAGFLREGVHLAVVLWTWGPEQSTTIRPQYSGYAIPLPVAFYADALAAARGGRHLVSVSAIANLSEDPATCPEKVGSGDQGRISEVARLTGGIAFDFCNQDWHGMFEAFRTNWTNFSRMFGLKGTVDERYPMEVLLDGQPVPSTQWTFDRDGGVVILATTPAAGAKLDVTYTATCQ